MNKIDCVCAIELTKEELNIVADALHNYGKTELPISEGIKAEELENRFDGARDGDFYSPSEEYQSNTEALIYKINNWGVERNITDEGGATVLSQMSKMQEEFAEFLATWDSLQVLRIKKDKLSEVDYSLIKSRLRTRLEDDFGDMLVCLIQAMRLAKTDFESCLECAWQDIRLRKGRMENGKFIKDSAS